MAHTKTIQRFSTNKLLHTTAIISVIALTSSVVWAGPQNGVVTSGAASIAQLGNETTINQSSNRAIIRWDRFNVDQTQSVKFVQPSSNAIVINRILDNDPSHIDGAITANGKVILINPNGIVFGGTAKIDVGALVATTSDLENDNDFMAGGAIKFTRPGNPNASIINNGEITVKQAGLVGLVAPHVENNGVIRAKLGKVQLASGDIHTIDLAGDGLIKIEVSDQVISQSVKNTGLIDAEGGDVLITAAQARHAVDALITNTGTIRANSIGSKKGSIKISAPKTQGVFENTGLIFAEGLNTGEKGGNITITAGQVLLKDNAQISASGDAGGGTLLIGGNAQGGEGLPTSNSLFVGHDVILSASSRREGDGGQVVLWSDDNTQFYGKIDATGGSLNGNGGNVEVSGKAYLDFNGVVNLLAAHGMKGSLLLDPTDITISSGANANITTPSPYAPNADSVTSVLSITTLQNALALGNVTVQTRATGAQAGNITVSNAITWVSGTTLTLSAANNITVNAAITGGSVTMIAGADVQLNANVSGSGILTIQQAADATTIGLGGGTGTLNLAAAEIAKIVGGWTNIIIGRATSTGAMTVNAQTWANNLTLQSGTGVITIAGIQNVGANNLTFVTDGDIALNLTNALTGTGTLTIKQATASTTIGLGGAAGTINLTATEITRIKAGWTDIIIGRIDGTGAITSSTATWTSNLTLKSGMGVIGITGVQTLGTNSLTFLTDGDLTIANTTNILTGTGVLTIQQVSAGTTIGLGDVGTINLTTTEVSRLTNTWSNVIIGRTDGTGAINVGTTAWNDSVTLQTGTGGININNTVTTGSNSLTLTTNGSDITTTGAISQTTGGLSMTATGGNISIGNTINETTTGAMSFTTTGGTITVGGGITKTGGTASFNSGTGVISINSAIGVGAANLSFVTDSTMGLNANISGTGTVSVSQFSTNVSLGIGTGQAGTISYDDTKLARFLDGFSSRSFGRSDSTADVNVASGTWVDSLILQSGTGQMNLNGALSMAANSLTIRTDSDVLITDNLSGTGTLAIVQASTGTSLGIGDGQIGTVFISTDEKAFMVDGWSSRIFGRVDSTADLNVAAGAWVDPLTLRTGSGVININGAQTFAANALTISTDGDLNIGGTLTSTGALVIVGSAAATTIGVGTGQAGSLQLSDTELTRFGTTWSSVTIGSLTATGDMNVGGRTWSDPLVLRTGSGALNINGNVVMGGNNLTLYTDSDLALNATISGTKALVISGASAATSIGVGTGQVGTLNLTNAEQARILDGFTSITIGSSSMTGALNMGAATWVDPLTLYTAAGQLNINGTQNFNANNVTIRTNSNIAINAPLTGTGTLTIFGMSSATTIGVGTGQLGTLSFTDAELDNFTTGWTNVIIGATSVTGAINIGARSWNNSMDFRTSTGALNINGAQNMGTNSLYLRTNTNLAIGYTLAGTGNIYILPSGNVSMGVGTGQAGTLSLTDAELAFIADGWNLIYLGSTGSTAGLNVGAYTWNDNVQFNTGATTALNINGAQNLGSNNLTILSAADINLTAALIGTGNLVIGQSTAAATIGINDTGTVNLTSAELAQITNGWNNVTFGVTTATGAMNVGAANWNDNVTFRSLSGQININGAQNTNSNNFTIQTDSNLAIAANITGTGVLTIQPTSNTTIMNIATGTTGLNLTNAELNFIQDGWSSQIYGLATETGAMNVGARTWTDNVTFQTASGLLTIAGATMGANNLTLSTNSNIAITGNLTGTGNLTIRNTSGNTAIGVGTGQIGAVVIDNNELARIADGWSNITIGNASSFGAINIGTNTWLDPITFVSQGNIVLNGVQISNAGGTNTNLIFATTGAAFINNAGASAIDPGTGRFLVYSTAEANDTLGGLSRPTILSNQSYNGYPPGSVVETGNVFLYSGLVAKILFLQIDDVDKIYGDINPTFTYTYISGLQNADTLGNVVISYVLNAAGSNILDNAGVTRVITGSFNTGSSGYTVNIVNGTLTVDKATVTVQADSDNRVYGSANPAFTISYDGFKNGDDETDLNVLATASTTATVTSNVNHYAITTSGASDGNYDFVYVDGDLEITKATLTATSQNSTREYGLANPAFTFNYTGFKNGDTAAVIDTNAMGNTLATIGSNVGTYAITGSGAVDNNYTFNYINTGSLTVTKATLTITSQNATREYGDANPTLSVAYSGFRNSDTIAVLSTLATPATAATATSNVGSYTITSSGAAATNYSFAYANTGNLTITKATLTATTQNATREYGDANPAFSIIYTGFKNGENSSIIDILGSAATTATTTSNVGSYAVTGSGDIDNNYTFTYANTGNLAITKALLTATTQNATREYGDANPALGIVYTGFKNGENNSVIDTLAAAATVATTTSNVGAYAVTGSGAVDNNYTFTYANTGNLAITKATLTATAQNATREYGDANPGFAVVYSGFKNGENSGVIDTLATGSTAAVPTSDVGSYTITAVGALDNNYNFNYVDGSLTITKATLTATAQNATRLYGDVNPTLNIVYTGFKNGDAVSVINTQATASTAAVATSNVGSYTIVASGALDDNYTFNYVNGSLSITKAVLTATSQNATRGYGDADPVLGLVYTGFKNSETAAVIDTLGTASTSATVTSNVGSYAVTGSGAVDNNYSFTYADTGNLTITKATVTATAQNKTREYGDANPVFTVVYSGFKNGENSGVIDTLATGSTGAVSTSDVGSYTITATGASDNNYNFNYADGSLVITKATLMATAQNTSREYGDANPVFTVAYTGFKNGENASVINTQAIGSTSATQTSNVGIYTITASGASDENYNFNYTNGNLTVNKAVLTATAQNTSREYGDANPTLGVVYTGFKNSDTQSVINVLAGTSTTATISSNVGSSYTITASGASDDNYSFNYVDGNLTIDKATVTATAQSITRQYGDANPTLTIVYSGFKIGQNVSVLDTAATATTSATQASNVGTYVISSGGGADDNYAFNYVDGTLDVTKAVLTATAQSTGREYGDINPAFTVVYTGFKNGEDISVVDTLATASTIANATSNVGAYTITASGAQDSNYSFNYATGSLTISKATLTATAQDASRIYGDANPALTVVYSGFKNSETASVINTLATAHTTAIATSNVGSYTVAASGASDNNYNFNYVDGNLSITKATLTATVQNKTRQYGDANPTFAVVYSGFKNSEAAGVIDTGITISTSATPLSDVGNYVIAGSGGLDNNYDFNYVSGNLGITKATLTATAQNVSRDYGDANPSLVVVYSGFKNGEDVSVIDTLGSASTAATTTSNVGAYTITAAGALDNNYSFNYVNGSLTINKAVLTVTAQDVARQYGDVNPALTVSYAGFKNGETTSVINTLASAHTTATTASNVGLYAITGSGGSDNNYAFNYVDGTLSIAQATLLATAQNKTREYGDANPGLTIVYTGFKNGDTASVIDTLATGSTVATQNSDVGAYIITASSAADNNYNFNYASGSLTITKATVTATAQNISREYAAANPSLGIIYTGFKNGENSGVLDTLAHASTVATMTSDAGNYLIAVAGAADNNYNIIHTNGILTVTKAVLTATVQDATREQYRNDPIFTVTYSGFKNGDNVGMIDALASGATSTDLFTAPGMYAINGYGGYDNNYTFNYIAGNLTILPPTIPAPTLPLSTIPGTVIGSNAATGHANETQSKQVSDTLNSTAILGDTKQMQASPIVLNAERIIVIPDQDIVKQNRNLYFLIAITEKLQQLFGYNATK